MLWLILAVAVGADETPPIQPQPRVQIVIYTDSGRCAPCRTLTARFRQRLQAAGWSFGPEQYNQFRVLEYDSHAIRFERRRINQVPNVAIVVDGVETPTTVRDEAVLAQQYLDTLAALNN